MKCRMIDCSAPFVLLDDARRDGASPARLYQRPVQTLKAADAAALPELLGELRKAKEAGLHAAGFIHYEAGTSLQPGGGWDAKAATSPVAWFGLFQEYQQIKTNEVPSWLHQPAGAWLGDIRPDLSRQAYRNAFQAVQDYIRAGDIYQANLTFRASARYAGHPLALYAALRSRGAAGYGGIVYTGEDWSLSFSPELFFAAEDGRVKTKPMKGTAARHHDAQADMAISQQLQQDEKQRAENLMIVDLLRNDLSRVCLPGSVEVPELFKIESYPTVHQMISTVTGKLAPGKDAGDILKAIFPCGSITGAPKIRAMQIIEELEADARGFYCGSMGRIDPDGGAAFNVAIRSFSLCEDTKTLSLGLGSGVVADSSEADEWAECLAKGEFAKMQRADFDLIETMRFEPADGILRLELHLERMKESARALDFEFDRHDTRNRLHAATFHLERASKLRLLLGRSGAIAIEIGDVPAESSAPIAAALVPLPVDSSDFRLRHKTSDRAFYDEARRRSGCAEVLLVDTEGYLTEGSRSSIFLKRDGQLLTPPLGRGLLPGILRRELIESGRAIEADLRAEDLHDGSLMLGNSLRGLLPAKAVAKDAITA